MGKCALFNVFHLVPERYLAQFRAVEKGAVINSRYRIRDNYFFKFFTVAECLILYPVDFVSLECDGFQLDAPIKSVRFNLRHARRYLDAF